MKVSILVFFLCTFLLFFSIPDVGYGASGIFGGGFFSVFRSVQTQVAEIRSRVVRFFGVEEDFGLRPSLFITSFTTSSQVFVGSSQEVRWEYQDLKEGVTKVYLVSKDEPPALLVFLPALREMVGEDNYVFEARFEPGVYGVKVCNGEVCDVSGSVEFVSSVEL